jgi:hypothetical protein
LLVSSQAVLGDHVVAVINADAATLFLDRSEAMGGV